MQRRARARNRVFANEHEQQHEDAQTNAFVICGFIEMTGRHGKITVQDASGVCVSSFENSEQPDD